MNCKMSERQTQNECEKAGLQRSRRASFAPSSEGIACTRSRHHRRQCTCRPDRQPVNNHAWHRTGTSAEQRSCSLPCVAAAEAASCRADGTERAGSARGRAGIDLESVASAVILHKERGEASRCVNENRTHGPPLVPVVPGALHRQAQSGVDKQRRRTRDKKQSQSGGVVPDASGHVVRRRDDGHSLGRAVQAQRGTLHRLVLCAISSKTHANFSQMKDAANEDANKCSPNLARCAGHTCGPAGAGEPLIASALQNRGRSDGRSRVDGAADSRARSKRKMRWAVKQ